MSDDGRWRPGGDGHENAGTANDPGGGGYQQGGAGYGQGADQYGPARGAQGSSPYVPGGNDGDRTRDMPAYAPSGDRPGTDPAPTYTPSYAAGGGGGGGYPPSDPGEDDGGRRGFPWIAVIIGIIAVAAAAAAVWYFLLRDSEPTDEATTPVESVTDETATAGPEDPEATEESTTDATEEPTEDDTTTEDPDEPTEDDTSAPALPEPPTDGGEPDDAIEIELEIGETHTLPNGADITLDEVDRDYECALAVGQDLVALTFTVDAAGASIPTDTPVPGITLSTSEGDLGLLDGAGCLGGDEGLPPVVGAGDESTGLVLVEAPTQDAFDLEFRPVLSGLGGDSPGTLIWPVD